MRCSETRAGYSTPTLSALRRSSAFPARIVGTETEWRVLPEGSLASTGSKLLTTRWRGAEGNSEEFSSQTPNDYHLVQIALRTMNVCLSVDGRTVHDGVMTRGTFHITEPATAARCLFRGPYDVLHLYLPNSLIGECAHDPRGLRATLPSHPDPRHDGTVERLAQALLEAERLGGSLGQLYVDSISLAIVLRLLASAREDAVKERRRVTELVRWRLKRAIDYIEARLAEPLSLGDLASSAGLTRMHFAAQFRAATGLRPHEFLLRRRIERAQDLLLGSHAPLVEVALSVGFQTQSHFATVFKRFAGQSPSAWRLLHRRPGDGFQDAPSAASSAINSARSLNRRSTDTRPAATCAGLTQLY
jgi:AraC family transcriptional regulator